MFGKKKAHMKVELVFVEANMTPNATAAIMRHYIVARCRDCKEVLASLPLEPETPIGMTVPSKLQLTPYG